VLERAMRAVIAEDSRSLFFPPSSTVAPDAREQV
jgi:hypothetical protein